MVADLLKALFLGLVEGVTEFLPISSTGHLIVAAHLLRFQDIPTGAFEIVIQLGAVLAVAWFYRHDLRAQMRTVRTERATQRLWLNLLIAFTPAAVVGLLFHEWIKAKLFSPLVVAVGLVLGGLALLAIERRPPVNQNYSLYSVTSRQAAFIGLIQTLALIPGVSRSAASIVGGLTAGLDRQSATAFSFYLALPTLGMASVFDLITNLDRLTTGDLQLMALGLVAAFATSLLMIGWLLRYVATHDFRLFAYYRIVVGIIIIAWSL